MSLDTIGQKARTRIQTGLTAIGSTQSDAFPLSNNTEHEFTTVGSGTGCILPMAYPSPPSQVSVFNVGSNALAVYPPLGGTINGAAVNAPYSLAAGTGLTYWASSLSNWYSIQTSASGGGSGTVNSGSSGQVAFYGSSGTAVSGEALSSLIDAAIGNMQGDVLYRSASAWSALTPGTSGQFLQTQGASANPQWASPSGSGTVNSGSSGQVAYYGSAGTAVSGEALSSLIDSSIGKTQGDVLYRSASAWSVLAPGASGQFLQTQGASANPQWASPSASGTVNSGSSGQVAYYGSAGTAVSGEALSALIDSSIGNTQGDVLYRSASAWSVLAPGASGQFLQTQGASANPQWASASGSGTVNSGAATALAYYGATGTAVSGATKVGYDGTNNCLLWTGQPDPSSPVAGDQWFSSAAGGLVCCRFVDGSGKALITMDDGTFFRCGSCTTLATSSSLSTLLASPTNSWGSLTIPSGALKAGQVIEIDFQCLCSTISSPTFLMEVYFGSTVVANSSTQTMPTSITNGILANYHPVTLRIRSVGAAGSINAAGVSFATTAGAPTSWYWGTASRVYTDLTGINYNQANTLDLRGQWSVASSANTVQILGFTARLNG